MTSFTRQQGACPEDIARKTQQRSSTHILNTLSEGLQKRFGGQKPSPPLCTLQEKIARHRATSGLGRAF